MSFDVGLLNIVIFHVGNKNHVPVVAWPADKEPSRRRSILSLDASEHG